MRDVLPAYIHFTGCTYAKYLQELQIYIRIRSNTYIHIIYHGLCIHIRLQQSWQQCLNFLGRNFSFFFYLFIMLSSSSISLGAHFQYKAKMFLSFTFLDKKIQEQQSESCDYFKQNVVYFIYTCIQYRYHFPSLPLLGYIVLDTLLLQDTFISCLFNTK